ncbi:MAG: DUF2330 domain-containing protein [Myxococcota bacterium]|nr:DUF2330 domain-containing protein [Myxococcota bacterium]
MKRLLGLCLLCVLPSNAEAFCGFFVSGADAKLYNNASQVALMRKGTRTVMSMSNNYQGPPENFAMVVPVPVILKKENVKTLPLDVFEKIDRLSAPRLVEYWERDPCRPIQRPRTRRFMTGAVPPMAAVPTAGSSATDLGVTVEAEFVSGEYTVVILSAKEAAGLETWLKMNNYTIPDGASDALAPYVNANMKFFVAKVDLTKVKRDTSGLVTLSPLRFEYESKQLRLPVRLGLLNAQAKQDLLVYILHPKDRYEVANYKNIFIPSNLEVENDVRRSFGAFYAALFDRALEAAGGSAVVTEYAWQTTDCDPCPVPPLTTEDMLSLGGDLLDEASNGERQTHHRPDIIFSVSETQPSGARFSVQKTLQRRQQAFLACVRRELRPADMAAIPSPIDGSMQLEVNARGRVISAKTEGFSPLTPTVRACFDNRLRSMRFPAIKFPVSVNVDSQVTIKAVQQTRRPRRPQFSRWVLTRLHTRYDKNTLSEDLVFAPAKPVVGGRGSAGASREPPGGTRLASTNQFQGRYIIRHFWSGEVACDNPVYHRWGGPPNGGTGPKKPMSATGLAHAKRGHIKLPELIRSALPQWNIPGKPMPKR